jgi:hypothetical protein
VKLTLAFSGLTAAALYAAEMTRTFRRVMPEKSGLKNGSTPENRRAEIAAASAKNE